MRINKKTLLTSKKFFGGREIKINGGRIKNTSNKKRKVVLKRVLVISTPYLRISFCGKLKNNEGGAELRLISLDRKWVSESVELNSETLLKLRAEPRTKRYLLYINIPAGVSVKMERLELVPWKKYSIIGEKQFGSDILIITPMYPSPSKPYSATFVYSKVKEYAKNGITPDIVVATNYESRLYNYQFKGSQISKVSFDDLRNIVQRGKYQKILIHFFDREICNALLACDLDNAEIFIYCHGADVDLWNPNIFSKYFECDHKFSQEENEHRQDRLEALRLFEGRPNVKWIFNTQWNLDNSRKVTGLEFANHKIIPCVIDKDNFVFQEREGRQRLNILVLKKMDNVRQYAVDLAVRIIERLSSKDYFNDLHFTVGGAGDYQKELTNPLRKYNNVEIVDGFFDHDKINEVFSKNGILLAPSRYDTQGVTVGEAAMSGMVVLASRGTGVSDMLPESLGTFFNNEDIDEATNIIDDIVSKKVDIGQLSTKFHDAISKTASVSKINDEIKLIKSRPKTINRLINSASKNNGNNSPVLSIAIPAYNAAQYVENTIKSMVNHKKVDLLEIIVVNDGSKDDTAEVVKNIIKVCSPNVRKIIKFIDKENGGHGSTINAALAVAKGKYFRVVDADDRLDSKALEKHLEFLCTTDADIVFTNTVHDYSVESEFRPDHKYDFMEPYIIYRFDELCEPYYGFKGYGPVLSTTSTKTENLRKVGCKLTEKSFYVDIEYNYFMTEASRTAVLDPVDLYYYYLGRDGQSLSDESYKRNFSQHLNVLESVIKLLERNKLSKMQYDHFVRVQLHETISHQYKIAVEMCKSYKKYKQVEKILKKYPKYYNDASLIPGYAKRMRKLGLPYFYTRRLYKKARSVAGACKRLLGA